MQSSFGVNSSTFDEGNHFVADDDSEMLSNKEIVNKEKVKNSHTCTSTLVYFCSYHYSNVGIQSAPQICPRNAFIMRIRLVTKTCTTWNAKDAKSGVLIVFLDTLQIEIIFRKSQTTMTLMIAVRRTFKIQITTGWCYSQCA